MCDTQSLQSFCCHIWDLVPLMGTETRGPAAGTESAIGRPGSPSSTSSEWQILHNVFLVFLKTTTKNPNTHELPVRNNPVGDHSGAPTADSREKLTVGALVTKPSGEIHPGVPHLKRGPFKNNPTPHRSANSRMDNPVPADTRIPAFLLTLPCSVMTVSGEMARRAMSLRGQWPPLPEDCPGDNSARPGQTSSFETAHVDLKPGYRKTIQPMPSPKSLFLHQ